MGVITVLATASFWFSDRVSLYIPGCPGTHCVAQALLRLRAGPVSASGGLGLEVCKLDRHFLNSGVTKKKKK